MPEIETLRLRVDLVGKPHDYVREEVAGDRGLRVGDLVRSRNRRRPGRTVYWLRGIQSNGEDCTIQCVSLPGGARDNSSRHLPGKISRLELTPIAQTPSWLVRRARSVPAGIMAWAESGAAELFLSEKPAPQGPSDPIAEMDRLSLRQACLGEGLTRQQTVDMSPDDMRRHLRNRNYEPPPGAISRPRRSATPTTAREEARVRAGNTLHPVVLEMLPTEDLLKITRGGELDPLLHTIREMSVRLRAAETIAVEEARKAETAVASLTTRTQELATARSDRDAARVQLQDARTVLVQAEARGDRLQEQLDSASGNAIPDTEENREALRVGKELMKQRRGRVGGGRFDLIRPKRGGD